MKTTIDRVLLNGTDASSTDAGSLLVHDNTTITFTLILNGTDSNLTDIEGDIILNGTDASLTDAGGRIELETETTATDYDVILNANLSVFGGSILYEEPTLVASEFVTSTIKSRINDISGIADDVVIERDSSNKLTIGDGAVSLNSMDISGVTSINGTDSGSGANYGQIGGRRNMVYNGDMQISQRSTSVSGIGNGDSGYHTLDRWVVTEQGSVGGIVTMSQSTTTPDGFNSSMKFDCTTAEGSVAAAEQWRFEQRFEGQDLQGWNKGDVQARSLTLSFWVNATKTGTNTIILYDNDNSRSISKAYTVDTTNTWEKKTIAFAGDTIGALDNDNAASIQLMFLLVAGSNFTSGTLNTSWGSHVAANSCVGQVNNLDNTSNNFHITGVQLELGDTATAFEYESYGENLARCQRYMYKGEDIVYGSYAEASQAGYANVWFPVTMRADPTVTGVNSNSTAQGVSRNRIDCYRVGGYPFFDAGHTAIAEI